METTTSSSCKPTPDRHDEIIGYLVRVFGNNVEIDNVEEVKSAQQQVMIITLSRATNEGDSEPSKTVVLRKWKNSAKWWNLHRNHHVDLPSCCESNKSFAVEQMAHAEVSAYRIAKQALPTTVHIPTVLYFSHDDNHDHDQATNGHLQHKHNGKNNNKYQKASEPWALLEYVGPSSEVFCGHRQSNAQLVPCRRWMDSMIKDRLEFGFMEPHPRWGRVPEDQCLEYAMHLLQSVILPMHKRMLSSNHWDWNHLGVWSEKDERTRPRGFDDMLYLYQSAQETMELQISSCDNEDVVQKRWIGLLKKGIDTLRKETQQEERSTETKGKTLIPGVLCHMDLQPQNLIFGRQDNAPRVVSVLDWEEAAYADPRFELLMLCRKVCANRDQAQRIWDYYTCEMANGIIMVGPMEPWLKLETLHSLSTLLLQSMNLLGGGRNPWETKPDLLLKIQREWQRLYNMGWTFCKMDDNSATTQM